MNMNVFNTAKRLYDAYGTSSWRRAMRIKRRVCDCEDRSRADCCPTFRFWSRVEGVLDCHRYGDSTGSGNTQPARSWKPRNPTPIPPWDYCCRYEALPVGFALNHAGLTERPALADAVGLCSPAEPGHLIPTTRRRGQGGDA